MHFLQDHLQIRTVYRVSNATTLNLTANSLIGEASMALDTRCSGPGRNPWRPASLGARA